MTDIQNILQYVANGPETFEEKKMKLIMNFDVELTQDIIDELWDMHFDWHVAAEQERTYLQFYA